jgi:hypothetical protein
MIIDQSIQRCAELLDDLEAQLQREWRTELLLDGVDVDVIDRRLDARQHDYEHETRPRLLQSLHLQLCSYGVYT